MEAGLAEEIELIDSGSNDRTKLLGQHAAATFQIEETHNEERSLDSGGKPAEVQEGPVDFMATLTIKPETLEALRIMGNYKEPTNSTYEVTFPGDEQLELHNYLRGQIMDNSSDSKYFEFRNVKFGRMRLTVGAGDAVQIEFPTIMAKDGDIQDGTIDAADVTGKSPLQWTDADLLIDGSTVGTIESVQHEVDRDPSSEHGISSSTGADARKPAAIVEGNYQMLPSFVIKIEDPVAWEKALDDSGSTLEVQGSKNTQSISLDFGGTSGKLKFTGAKFEIEEYEMSEDKEVRTVELSGFATDVKVEGDQ